MPGVESGIFVCLNCGHRIGVHRISKAQMEDENTNRACKVMICECKEFVLDPTGERKPR